jgi:hypothetical protein
MDAESAYEVDHAALFGHLERLGVPYRVDVDCDPDEDGPNVHIELRTSPDEQGHSDDRTEYEVEFCAALAAVETGDAEALAAVLADPAFIR